MTEQNAYREAAAALVVLRGTPSQVQRLRAGVLPDEEMHAVVRDRLFEGVKDVPRWIKVDKHEVKRIAVGKGLATEEDEVVTAAVPADSLSEAQWNKRLELLEKITSAAGDVLLANFGDCVHVESFWFVVTCGSYEKRHLKFRVTVRWLGIDHVREVAP